MDIICKPCIVSMDGDKGLRFWVLGSRFWVQDSGFWVLGSRFWVPSFAFQATQGKQGSAQPPTIKGRSNRERKSEKANIDILRFAVPNMFYMRADFILLTAIIVQPLISNSVNDYKCFIIKIRPFTKMTSSLFNWQMKEAWLQYSLVLECAMQNQETINIDDRIH
jgi:hypothetical protein